MNLHFCCDIQMIEPKIGINNMKVWNHPALHQLYSLVVVEWYGKHFLGIHQNSWYHCLNATAYLGTVADHVLQSLIMVHLCNTSSRTMHNVTNQKLADWIMVHINEVSELKCPPQSLDLNPTEHLWDVVKRKIQILDVQHYQKNIPNKVTCELYKYKS